MRRVEVLCARCDGHLDNVLKMGPKPDGASLLLEFGVSDIH